MHPQSCLGGGVFGEPPSGQPERLLVPEELQARKGFSFLLLHDNDAGVAAKDSDGLGQERCPVHKNSSEKKEWHVKKKRITTIRFRRVVYAQRKKKTRCVRRTELESVPQLWKS